MEREEGEMSDDDQMEIDDEELNPKESFTLVYKPEKPGVLVDELVKTDAAKLEDRANRFGLDLTGAKAITQKQIDELYTNFNIEGNERHFRLDTIHLSGVDGLSTKSIFKYLEDYKPISIEWINENSCNVVCQDHISVALALLVHSREIRNEELKNALQSSSIHHWREGYPHPKKDIILFRIGTNSDNQENITIKQERNCFPQNSNNSEKNPWGDLCKSWGVYDHQESFPHHKVKPTEDKGSDIGIKNRRLAKRLGKRNYDGDEQNDSNSDSEWNHKMKAPRMRMHADDEELVKQKHSKVSYKHIDDHDLAPLSIEISNTELGDTETPAPLISLSEKFKKNLQSHLTVKEPVQSRLGVKVKTLNEDDSNEDSVVQSEGFTKSRVHRVLPNEHKPTIWSRLDNNQARKDTPSDLRKMLKSKKSNSNKSADLRSRLGKSGQSKAPLRVEIDNNYFVSR